MCVSVHLRPTMPCIGSGIELVLNQYLLNEWMVDGMDGWMAGW